jgi:hypothetical protein
MTKQHTEKCNACEQIITPPTDAITEQNYKEFKTTGYCKTCRDNLERRQFFEEQKDPVPEQPEYGTKENPIELVHLNDIESPTYAGKHVTVSAIIASNSYSHTIPKEFECITPQRDYEGTIVGLVKDKILLDLTDPINLSTSDIPKETLHRRLKTNTRTTSAKD